MKESENSNICSAVFNQILKISIAYSMYSNLNEEKNTSCFLISTPLI